MQNSIQKFRQSSIVFEKPGILPAKLKNLTSSNYRRVEYFLLKVAHISYIPMSTKGCLGFLLFVAQIKKKTWFLQTHRNQALYVFLNNLKSKKN